MPSTGRIFTYSLVVWSLLLVAGGGFGALLPSIFNMDGDLMFVLLPAAVLGIVVTLSLLVRVLVRMAIKDYKQYNS